jgi:hypothetical protein
VVIISGHHQWSSSLAIRGPHTQSVVISVVIRGSNQWQSVAIQARARHQRQSVTISGNQEQLETIRGNQARARHQWQSLAIIGNQEQSEAIRLVRFARSRPAKSVNDRRERICSLSFTSTVWEGWPLSLRPYASQ